MDFSCEKYSVTDLLLRITHNLSNLQKISILKKQGIRIKKMNFVKNLFLWFTQIILELSKFSRTKSLFLFYCLLFHFSLSFSTPVMAQVTTPATINGGNPIGQNNLGGTTSNTQNFGSLGGLGTNQGVTFTFTGDPNGGALWNGGFSFLSNQILQLQPDASGLPANAVNYELNFTDDVYGLQFRLSGLDNGDETVVTFFRDGVAVPVTVSTYVNGGITVPRVGNIISFAGTNLDIDPSGNGFRADGDGNNDSAGIGIHGLQEGFLIALPLGVAVDEVRLSPTGKNNGSGGNVTLILTDFAWARPSIALTKSSSFSQGGNGESNVGDIVTYTYVATNNGNVPLSNISLDETAFTGSGTTPTPTFSIGTSGATPANFPQGETLTYTASYPASAIDLLAGSIDNQGTVTALAGDDAVGQEISDLSDSFNLGDGGAVGSFDEDDSTTTTFPAPIVFNPSIEAVKTADITGFSNPIVLGDTISYSITVSNTGDVDLSSITLIDTLTNGDLTVLSPPAPAFVSSTLGSPEGQLIVGETATYSFSYTISQTDVDSESLSNSVTANANAFTGGTINDVSDDGDDGDGNVLDDPTVTPIIGEAVMSVTKVANDTIDVQAGQSIVYTYRVTNTGNQTLRNISLNDVHDGSGSAPIPDGEVLSNDVLPLNDSTDSTSGTNGIWDLLAPGDEITFTATYIVTQQDVDTLQ